MDSDNYASDSDQSIDKREKRARKGNTRQGKRLTHKKLSNLQAMDSLGGSTVSQLKVFRKGSNIKSMRSKAEK